MDREKRLLSKEAEALLAGLRRAKEDLRAAQAKLRTKKVDEAGLREASRAIDRVAAQASLGGELEELTMRDDVGVRVRVKPEEVRRGAKVFVPKLRAEAEVLEVSANGQVRVAIGPMKLNVTMDELRASEAPKEVRDARRAAPHKEAAYDGNASATAPIQTSDNTCDLRGLRADDAVAMATSFLDRSLNEGRRVAFLIHGHGTGSLRESIRKELKASPYVAHFRAGESGEGGDGVTVAWLA
jgi:DNA mismatch repair protein MutS2